MSVNEEADKNSCENSVGFGEKDNIVCENECHIVLEDTCLNQDATVIMTNVNQWIDWHWIMIKFYKEMKIKYLNNSLYLYIRKKKSN